jgi:hypothetical protein
VCGKCYHSLKKGPKKKEGKSAAGAKSPASPGTPGTKDTADKKKQGLTSPSSPPSAGASSTTSPANGGALGGTGAVTVAPPQNSTSPLSAYSKSDLLAHLTELHELHNSYQPEHHYLTSLLRNAAALESAYTQTIQLLYATVQQQQAEMQKAKEFSVAQARQIDMLAAELAAIRGGGSGGGGAAGTNPAPGGAVAAAAAARASRGASPVLGFGQLNISGAGGGGGAGVQGQNAPPQRSASPLMPSSRTSVSSSVTAPAQQQQQIATATAAGFPPPPLSLHAPPSGSSALPALPFQFLNSNAGGGGSGPGSLGNSHSSAGSLYFASGAANAGGFYPAQPQQQQHQQMYHHVPVSPAYPHSSEPSLGFGVGSYPTHYGGGGSELAGPGSFHSNNAAAPYGTEQYANYAASEEAYLEMPPAAQAATMGGKMSAPKSGYKQIHLQTGTAPPSLPPYAHQPIALHSSPPQFEPLTVSEPPSPPASGRSARGMSSSATFGTAATTGIAAPPKWKRSSSNPDQEQNTNQESARSVKKLMEEIGM